MSEHIFKTTLCIKKPLEEVFAFFSMAENLERITPPELRFNILTPTPIEMKPGAVIEYRLKLMGIGFKWKSLISVWEPPKCFVDEQITGPYKTWIHTHSFTEDVDTTIMTDEVRYSLPFYPLGEIGLPFVKLKIRQIFSYREKVIRSYFS